MNLETYRKITVTRYILDTDIFPLTKELCGALEIPSSKCALHNLRHYLAYPDFLSTDCSPLENLLTNEGKGTREQSVKVLIASHFSSPSTPREFTTRDIPTLQTIPRSTIAKAINELSRDRRIETIDDKRRPKLYRWIPETQPDKVDVFMKVYSVKPEQSTNQFCLALLPCHLNRSICGLSYLGDNITVRIRERMDKPIINNEEIACFEAGIARLLPYVISSGGDSRIFNRRVEEEISLKKRIRKLLSQIDGSDVRRELLEKRCLSDTFLVFIESATGKRSLYESCRKVCGDEIHREEVNVLLPKIIMDMCCEFPFVSYDKNSSSLVSTMPIDKQQIESVLTKTMKMYTLKNDKPLKRVNVKDIYREAALELMRQGGQF
jgi:hypothetical protein